MTVIKKINYEKETLEVIKSTLLDKALADKNFDLCAKLTSNGWESHVIGSENITLEEKEKLTKYKIPTYYSEKELKKRNIAAEDLQKYKEESLVTHNVIQVKNSIEYFKKSRACSQEVLKFLDHILDDTDILYKIQIVKRADYINCVILVADNSTYVVKGQRYRQENMSAIEFLDYLKENTETIFLIF